jgi:hypothetical protein
VGVDEIVRGKAGLCAAINGVHRRTRLS